MIETKTMVSIHNRFDIVVRNAITREVEEEFTAHNIVLDRMYTRLLNFQPFFNNIVFGTGAGTPSVDRTTLFNRIGSKTAVEEQLIRAYPTSVWTKKITLGTQEFNGMRITEVGISETTTNINTHAMITDAEGNPLDVEKTSLRIVEIYATIFAILYDVDSGLFWFDDGLRDYLTGTGAAGNVLGISVSGMASERTNLAGTIVTNLSEKTVKNSVRFDVQHHNKEVGCLDWVGIGLRCKFPRFGVFEGKQRNNVELGTADGVNTSFVLPQRFIKDLIVKVDGVPSENWQLIKIMDKVEVVFDVPPTSGAVTADYFCDLYPKDTKHVIDYSMEIQFGIGQPSPVIEPYPFPIEYLDLPGAKVALGGDALYGFFGEVAAVDLISGDALCTEIGLTAGTSRDSDAGWLKYIKDGRLLFTAKENIRHSVSWNHINAVGAVLGEKEVTIGNNVYAVRLLSTGEWDGLIQPIHKDGINPRWGIYDDADLNISGIYTWTSTISGTTRVMRGNYSVGHSYAYSPSNAHSGTGFRPVLEFLYSLPSS